MRSSSEGLICPIPPTTSFGLISPKFVTSPQSQGPRLLERSFVRFLGRLEVLWFQTYPVFTKGEEKPRVVHDALDENVNDTMDERPLILPRLGT